MRWAVEHPDVVRTIAQKFWGDDLANPEEVSEEEGRLAEVMNLWDAHRRLDIVAAKAAAPIDKPKDKWGRWGHVDYEVFPPLIASLARLTDSAGRVETLSKLREMTSNVDLEKAKRSGDNNNLSLRLPIRTAAAIGSVEPRVFDTHFMEPLQAELTDSEKLQLALEHRP